MFRDWCRPEDALKFWGVFKLMVGLLATAESLMGMLRSVNAPETSIWGALTFAAAVLLAIDGIEELSAAGNRWVFVALASLVPIGISVFSGDWPARLWMFAIAIGFVEWVFLELKQTTARSEIGLLVCCVTLAMSLGNTTVMLFRMYWNEPQFWPLGAIFRFMLPIALPWTLILILLMHSARELTSRGSEPADEAWMATTAADD